MSNDLINVEMCGRGGKVISKPQNIIGITLFSDLLAVCKNDLKNIDLIVNQDVKTITVKGKLKGGGEKIHAVVDENYNLADICFNQDLFESKPTIHIAYEYHQLPFYFSESDGYDCTLKYTCGSKKFGEAFLNEINISKERLLWTSKSNENHYTSIVGSGMQSETVGLNTENCVVFAVTPAKGFKEGIIKHLDSNGITHKITGCKHAVLFRNAAYLKSSLQSHLSEPLTEGVVHLLLYKMTKPKSSSSSRVP